VGISLQQIARALNGEVRGQQVLAPGPGHSAEDRSLSVIISASGDDIIVHSFAADDPITCKKYVREKCGIKPNPNGKRSSDDVAKLLRDAVRSQRQEKPKRKKQKIVETYPYSDPNDKLLYQVLRFEPKDFRQRRPDGNGGWIWKLEDRRVLYRWPDLLRFPSATVFVTEGEKDANRLWSFGLCATTTAAGVWTAECVHALADRDVLILEDNDKPGCKKAQEVAGLLHPVAASVRVVRLPGLATGEDVSDWLDVGHSKEELENICLDTPLWEPPPVADLKLDNSADDGKAREPKPHLPDLFIDGSDPTATAKELAVLIAQRDDFLFNGNAPVRIAGEAGNLPRAIEVTNEAVRVMAHRVCRPVRLRKGALVSAALTKDIASLYLNGLEGNWGLRPFRGITTTPILGADGSIRTAQGYDQASGLWCHGILELVVPEKPSEADARAALLRLRDVFRTFPFGDGVQIHDPALGIDVIDASKPPGLDESTFLVALLTAVCRQSLELAPGYLVRAPRFSGAGTGKGLAIKAICIIGSGVRPSAFTSGHDHEELDKRLTAALIEAWPALLLDNYNAKELKSDILASVLTESPAMVRPMGQSKTVPLHTRTFIGITGNAVEIAEDMARRIISTNFDAHMENPEQRKFRPGFLDHVFASRNRLLSDALTIWRFGRQNKQQSGRPLGSYEVWAEWCRDPLLALGVRDPVDRIAEIKAADPRRRTLVAVFDAWWEKHADTTLKAKDLDPSVIELIDPKANRKSDGSLQFNRQRVASFLTANIGTRLSGYVLEQQKDDTLTRPLAYYKLQNDPENAS
jgi:hypothetical protein